MFNYCAILGVWFPGCPLFRGNFVLESAVGSVVWWPRAFRDSNSYFRRPISDFRRPISDFRSPLSDFRCSTFDLRIPISKLQYGLACCVDPSAIIARADKIRKKQASHSVSKCGKSQYLEMIQRHLIG